MEADEKAYFCRRAEEELERAAASLCPPAVRAHYLLAGHYLDRVYGEPEDKGLMQGAG